MAKDKPGGSKTLPLSPPPTDDSSDKVKPAMEIRIGRIKAAIWLNHTDHGQFFSVTFTRLYKDGEDHWQRSDTFGRDDLLVLAKVADLAHSWIVNETQSDTPF